MSSDLVSHTVDVSRLQQDVRTLEGVRHPRAAPRALEQAAGFVRSRFRALDLEVSSHRFPVQGQEHRNVVGRLTGEEPSRPRVLVGAHYDTVENSPGADDNASGVAVMLEAARLLHGSRFSATVEFVAFGLEEPQGSTYRLGSRSFAAAARRREVAYAGALILEMVGYTCDAPDSQNVPALLFWKRVPSRGTFLAAAGDWRSGRLLHVFTRAAGRSAPELELVTLRVPFRGWPVAQTRLSDNASFWDHGYPALMLTDTAFLRNPHYHTPEDRWPTLDYDFMARVTTATVGAVEDLAEPA